MRPSDISRLKTLENAGCGFIENFQTRAEGS